MTKKSVPDAPAGFGTPAPAAPTPAADVPAAPAPAPAPAPAAEAPAAPVPPAPPAPLRTDGPTLAEYVAAGYEASSYPPAGYAEVPEPVGIVAMIRDPAAYPAPHSADVHPDEVANYSQAGWIVAE